jgi:two-component system, NtrC family, phosphoglycerate transport system sensor histidine kinase PgtB
LNKIAGDPKLTAYAEGILSTMRHQLGNAVNALKVTLDVLQKNFEDFDDAKKKEYLKRASELLGRQEALIEAMRSYSNVNASDQKPMEFLSFWQHVVEEASRRLEKQNIKLIHHFNGTRCLIIGTPIALDTVMRLLLDNALEALEQVDHPEIELEASWSDGTLAISVRDNGCGIREKDRPKVFVPLFTTKPGRRGMGLPIALKLLSGMGGRMELEVLSEGGTRAKVWLRMPGGEKHEETLQV